ncbi:MAG: glutamate--tRNA ligase [Theionarchaea archaeon]|nr:glutamate--tRNA ligase [Theionarchaea archaeon]
MDEKRPLEELIRAFALKNAQEHGGEARMSSVLGSVFSARDDLRSMAGEVAKLAGGIIKEVNSLSREEQVAELEGLDLPEKQEREKQKGLPDLPEAREGEVVMRLAPFPSGMLHLGHMRMAILNDEYVKRYNGKLILVIDDTAGSADKIPIIEAYEGIPRDLEWMGIEVHETVYKSDRLDIFYSYARRFLEEGWAYVCKCDVAELRKKRALGEECSCRSREPGANLEDWERMLSGDFVEGEAAVRIKTDMNHPDAAFRDRVLLRISERPHPRVGTRYRVWPMLEFSWAIDDHLLGVTHVLRGKELMMEDRMERFMWDLLGWPEPVIIHHGMLRIADAKISKSECRRKIESGEYEGWEDPRTWTLGSLRKRGIGARAIRTFIVNSGLTLTDVQVPVETLYSENRKIIDPVANRYNFVRDPVSLVVSGAPPVKSASLQLHPDFPDRGQREVPADPERIYVDAVDFDKLEGDTVRLKDLFNVTLEREATYKGEEVAQGRPKIQWVSEPKIESRVIMPDGCSVRGFADPGVGDLDLGEIVQFIRFGFCRLDFRDGPIYTFRYAHA